MNFEADNENHTLILVKKNRKHVKKIPSEDILKLSGGTISPSEENILSLVTIDLKNGILTLSEPGEHMIRMFEPKNLSLCGSGKEFEIETNENEGINVWTIDASVKNSSEIITEYGKLLKHYLNRKSGDTL